MSDERAIFLETADFEAAFKELVRSVAHDVAGHGLTAAAHDLLAQADDEAPQTPYLTGDLRSQRQVEEPTITDYDVSVVAGYNSKYATYQHEGERKDGSHVIKEWTTTQVPQPGAKFLEKKMAGNAKRFMAICADAIRRKLGGSPR